MTTPPDFGGREIEHGAQEDLGAPPEPGHARRGDETPARGYDENEAHAPGSVCEQCGAVITAGQDVRRRADGQWVHEACPAPGHPAPPAAGQDSRD